MKYPEQAWQWVNVDENRRRIRLDTLRHQWQYVSPTGVYHDAQENTFGGAVDLAVSYEGAPEAP